MAKRETLAQLHIASRSQLGVTRGVCKRLSAEFATFDIIREKRRFICMNMPQNNKMLEICFIRKAKICIYMQHQIGFNRIINWWFVHITYQRYIYNKGKKYANALTYGPYSSLKTTERHSTLQPTLSRHQSSRVQRCRGVSGSVVRGTRDLSPAASRWFPMVLGDTAGATCTRISSLDTVRAATAAHTMRQTWRESVLRGRPEPGFRVWECSTDHCWKQRYTTDTLCPTIAAIRRYVHPASAGLQCDPVKMAEVVQ